MTASLELLFENSISAVRSQELENMVTKKRESERERIKTNIQADFNNYFVSNAELKPYENYNS